MNRPTVLIADDHASVLERLVALLNDRFDVVGAVTDGARLVDAALRLRPAVIITDISMPCLTGIEAIQQLRRGGLDAKFIVLTMHADVDLADESIRAGASAFVVKIAAGRELMPAIDEALAGRLYVTPMLEWTNPRTWPPAWPTDQAER
jgi:DNA-binding NarL/FixJ family response regulator